MKRIAAALAVVALLLTGCENTEKLEECMEKNVNRIESGELRYTEYDEIKALCKEWAAKQ